MILARLLPSATAKCKEPVSDAVLDRSLEAKDIGLRVAIRCTKPGAHHVG